MRSWVAHELTLHYGSDLDEKLPIHFNEGNQWGFKTGPMLIAEKERFEKILSEYGVLMCREERWSEYEREVKRLRKAPYTEEYVRGQLIHLSRKWLENEVLERQDMERAHLLGKQDRARQLAGDSTRAVAPEGLNPDERQRLIELQRSDVSQITRDAEHEAQELRRQRLGPEFSKGRGRGRGGRSGL